MNKRKNECDYERIFDPFCIKALMTIFQGISQEYEKFVQCFTVNKSSSYLDLDETINALILEEKRSLKG